MYAEFFTKSPLLALPILALGIFVTVFAVTVIRALGAHGRSLASAAERLPLENDASSGRRS